MKKKHIFPGLYRAIALMVLAALLLCGCTNVGNTDVPTEPIESVDPTETTGEIIQPSEEQTEPSQDPTEPSEDPTEPSEDPTEPSEDATEPTPGGSTTPGGTTGPSIGETDKEEEEEFVIGAPGAEDNPYTEALTQLPGSFTTVKIPVGGTIYYDVYGAENTVLTVDDPDGFVILGETTYEADETGVVTLELKKQENGIFHTFQVGNKSVEEKAFVLNFAEPEGSAGNPAIIASLEEIQLTLEADDADGYFYQWLADQDGIVTLYVDAIAPETARCEIVLTNAENSIKLSENGVTDEATGITALSMDVKEDDELLIQVSVLPDETGVIPEAQVTIRGHIGAPEGSQENPLEGVLAEIPGIIVTPAIEPSEFLYYEVAGASGTILTVQDPDAFVIYNGITYGADIYGVVTVELESVMGRQPIAFQVGNAGTEAEAYTLEFSLPLGAFNNPAELVLGENITNLEANDSDGYYYAWTAAEEGTLVISVNTDATTVGWFYNVSNTTAGLAGENHWSDDEICVTSETLEVAAGDVILVNVNTYDPASWNTPEGSVVIQVEFTEKPKPLGSLENPIWIGDVEVPNEVQVPANTTLYYIGYIFDMTMTVENAASMTMDLNGEVYTPDEAGILTVYFPAAQGMGRPMPVIFSITNGSETDGVYTMTFAYTVGHQMNPAPMVLGENLTTVPEFSNGYFYTWTATAEGLLTITMTGEDWFYVINNVTAGEYGEIQSSTDEYSMAGQTVTVHAGDEIQLTVNTSAGTAGEIGFNAEFVSAGTEDNPIWIMDVEAPMAITVAPSQTLHFTGYIFDMTMTAEQAAGLTMVFEGANYVPGENGVLKVEFPAAEGIGRPMPVTFNLINTGEATVSCNLKFAFPDGHQMNPALVVMGVNTATIAAGDTDGYWFTWIAGETGTLTITMPTDSGWSYVVNNLTTSRYGDNHNSSDPTAGVQTIQVTAGDEIQMNVSTYDPLNPYAAPTGQVVFQASFVAEEIQTEEPVKVYLEPNDNWLLDEARFAVYLWNEEGSVWVDMELDEETGYYVCEIPEGYTDLIFCRMDPKKEENTWENRWNQTEDLELDLTIEDNLYQVEPESWDKGEGKWTTLKDAIAASLAELEAQ